MRASTACTASFMSVGVARAKPLKPTGFKVRTKIVAWLVVVSLAHTMTATAATLFDTGAPDRYGGSFNTSLWILAGQFSLVENSTLTGANVYMVSQDPALPDLTGWDGTFEYFLYANDRNFQWHRDIPGTMLAFGTAQSVVATDTGVSANGTVDGEIGNIWLFRFDFEAPFGVTAGQEYWLGIHTANDYVVRDPLSWAFTGAGVLDAFDYQGTGNFSFDVPPFRHVLPVSIAGLLGCERDCHPFDDIPEPGSLSLLVLGLLGLALTRRSL